MNKKIIGDKNGITLRERLLLEIQYFKETGQNLDIDSLTLCSGSRYSDGFVPLVYRYYGGVVYVGRRHPQDRDVFLRARRAVSLDTSSFNTSESLSLDSAIRMVKNAGMIIYKPI